MKTYICNADGIAETVLAVCLERGMRVTLHEPNLTSDVKFKIEAPNRESYLNARQEWCARMAWNCEEYHAICNAKRSRTRL